jgi:RimJ/RimL family protein N-acetyltransferase
MSAQSNPFRSQNLTYRAFNSPDDDEFFHIIQSDPIAFANSCASLPRPADKSFTEKIRKSVIEHSILFVVICKESMRLSVPGIESRDKDGDEVIPETSKLVPIGIAFLQSASPDMTHHRCTELGIDIKREYQGQGYGTETIHWMLNWAFKTANLHRVELFVLGWNEGARRLYERIGFLKEGRKRQCLWKDGEWWDAIQMGMLVDEWEQARDRTDMMQLIIQAN